MLIEIKGLFGRFNYELDFSEAGVTIITGANGYGKTTILKMLYSLSKGNIEFFYDLDFEKIIISINADKLIIEKKIELLKNGDKKTYIVYINDVKTYPLDIRDMERYYLNSIRYNKFADKESEYLYDRNQIEYIIEQNQRRYLYKKLGKSFDLNSDSIEQQSEIMKEIKDYIGKIYFIDAQRLFSKNESEDKKTVNEIDSLPKKISLLIKQFSSEYSTVANGLDRTYPQRLFESDIGISQEEYDKLTSSMEDKFKKLEKYDIADLTKISKIDFKKNYARALKIYFDDFDKKYKVYEEFINQLDLFTSIVNSRLSFKKIIISRKAGITLVDTDNEDQKLDLKRLSSGEKHIIIMFYKLIFDCKNIDILLIDEPEISLHVTWQRKYMDDLLKVVNNKKIKVFVATHSPQIVSNYKDITIDLGEKYNEGRSLVIK